VIAGFGSKWVRCTENRYQDRMWRRGSPENALGLNASRAREAFDRARSVSTLSPHDRAVVASQGPSLPEPLKERDRGVERTAAYFHAAGPRKATVREATRATALPTTQPWGHGARFDRSP
jgi:hypothetical protein